MKVLPRTEFGNPILRTKTKDVPLRTIRTPGFQSLVKEMIYTMRRTGGVGLAAPQIGRPLRVAVLEMRPTRMRAGLKRKGPIVIINPKIVEHTTGIAKDWEGCLSFVGPFGIVPRARSITVEYRNLEGELVVEKASGLWARIFQHEIDHLDGIVYVDRMEDMKMLMTRSEVKKRLAKKKP